MKEMDAFVSRHIGPRADELSAMLESLKLKSLDELVEKALPPTIRSAHQLSLDPPLEEFELIQRLEKLAKQNQVYRSFIGMGYFGTILPSVIRRNILENPGWYTQYTPYQAEISQGRLEALLNFQTMISDLTGLEVANASLLDEATAAAEAMSLSFQVRKNQESNVFWISELCNPQSIAVVQTRAEPLGIHVEVGSHLNFKPTPSMFGILLPYPATNGVIYDYKREVQLAQSNNLVVSVIADLLALTLFKEPGSWGADIVVGSSQRFGVPLGYGGPHAAFFASKKEYQRRIPGRIVGVSKDQRGRPAVRLALQTREQHIRREKATSNICTAQVLLAIMASMYAVYHGPKELKKIAKKIRNKTLTLRLALEKLGHEVGNGKLNDELFDTFWVKPNGLSESEILKRCQSKKMNLRVVQKGEFGISLDETTTQADLKDLLEIFSVSKKIDLQEIEEESNSMISKDLKRTSSFLEHPVFNRYHSETEMQRYLRKLESKDLSLVTSMIPLGSCTMKLNSATEMLPVTWPEFSNIHPFVPIEQAKGYAQMIRDLEKDLTEMTGFSAVSFQPNAGSQGEYAGLLVIRKFHEFNGHKNRDVCLIPSSAHGTNPASASMAGMKVVVVKCDSDGNIDLQDLKQKAALHQAHLAALMITYPSTHGVFESAVKEICKTIHDHGGQVYMDGANLNALIGLSRIAELGADVCHFNLHKTFCIPHGGGGPGMGPIGVAQHLQSFLPSHPVIRTGGETPVGAVSAAPWGSPGILPISWAYIKMMGSEGLVEATKVAILNANYIAKRLDSYFPVLYRGKSGFVAHECIVDLRPLKAKTGVDVEDVAKRLMDYGFHAPTISFPVAGTMMIEPTESESQIELDRFCDAMISIRREIEEIEDGKADPKNNVLKNAPHTADLIAEDQWDRPYSRIKAVFPMGTSGVWQHKFWPSVSRIDNLHGDRNLICSCPPIEDYV